MLPLRVLELIVILVCVVDCSRALTTQEPVAVQTLQNQSWHHQSSVPEPSSAGGTSMRNKHKGKSVTTPSWEGRDDISPFKLAEKRLKRYKGKQTDFSGVLDFARDRFASGTEHRTKSLVKRQAESDLSRATESGPVTGEEKVAGNGVEVVAVPGCEGLCILPGFLTEEEQLQLAERCLADYPTPEHRSNLTPQHGRIERLWETREDLLEQLRWVTLGYQYDWTNRTYPPEHRVAVPCELVKYAEAASEAAGCSAVRAEAVIVNYYSLHSTLGGHLDDVEPDQTSAIVSISLGCAGVFLVGGRTKDEAPTPLFVRSGDVVVMSGESRRCYHGVPRVLSPQEDPVTGHLLHRWSAIAVNQAASTNEATHQRAATNEPASTDQPGAGNQSGACSHAPASSRVSLPPEAGGGASPNARRVVEYLARHRLNINIRQVFQEPPKPLTLSPKP